MNTPEQFHWIGILFVFHLLSGFNYSHSKMYPHTYSWLCTTIQRNCRKRIHLSLFRVKCHDWTKFTVVTPRSNDAINTTQPQTPKGLPATFSIAVISIAVLRCSISVIVIAYDTQLRHISQRHKQQRSDSSYVIFPRYHVHIFIKPLGGSWDLINGLRWFSGRIIGHNNRMGQNITDLTIVGS